MQQNTRIIRKQWMSQIQFQKDGKSGRKREKRKKDRVTNEGRTVGRKDTNEERKHTSKQEGNI